MPVHRGHLGRRRPRPICADHRHPLPRRPLRVEPAVLPGPRGAGQRREDLGRPPGRPVAIEPRSHRQQDVPGQQPERRRPHEQAHQRPDRVGGRDLGADGGRRDHQASRPRRQNIRTDKPTGRIGFGFQIYARRSVPPPGRGPRARHSRWQRPHRGQHRQTHGQEVSWPYVPVGTESSLRPVATEHVEPRIRFPGDDQGISLTNVK